VGGGRRYVWGPDRLSFVEHGRCALQQRTVDDIGVADDPPNVTEPHTHGVRMNVKHIARGEYVTGSVRTQYLAAQNTSPGLRS
jgi:hypothetical protein